MNDLTKAPETTSGTNISHFMAHRGAVIIKETRPIGFVNGMYDAILNVETLILTIVKAGKQNVVYGIVFRHNSSDGKEKSAAHLDFDEIEELINALDFIGKTAAEILEAERDYTELIYATKDDAKFGFFQKAATQTAFVLLSRLFTMFLTLDALDDIKIILQAAKKHLVEKGAQVIV